MRYLPEVILKDGTFTFETPKDVTAKYNAVSPIDVPEPISWADEERDVTAWLGNELQQEAFKKLYSLYEKIAIIKDPVLCSDFGHLQESDHFYYMCTKFFSDGEVHKYFNPYESPYEAFINYMNVLSDFMIRVNDEYSDKVAKFAAENTEKPQGKGKIVKSASPKAAVKRVSAKRSKVAKASVTKEK